MKPFTINIESEYTDLWRYNISLIGEVKHGDESIDIVRHSDEVVPVGSNIEMAPHNYNEHRNVKIETAAGDILILYIYIVAHSLPATETTNEENSFEVHIEIKHGEDIAYNRRHSVNIWSGDNIEIRLGDKERE